MPAVTDAEGWAALQTSPGITDADLLARIQQHVRAYTKSRLLIRAENLIEIRYEDLVQDQAGTMSRIYSRLGLGMPAEFSSPDSEKPYLPNRHAALEPSLAEQLREIYQPFYDAGLLNENADRSGRSGLR
ncbi:MAG: sulfotransferase [Sphaerospermopsis kisseleviana]